MKLWQMGLTFGALVLVEILAYVGALVLVIWGALEFYEWASA